MKIFKLHKTITILFLFVISTFGCGKEDCEELGKENCSSIRFVDVMG